MLFPTRALCLYPSSLTGFVPSRTFFSLFLQNTCSQSASEKFKEHLPLSTGHHAVYGNIIPPSALSPSMKSKIENWIDAVCPPDYLLPYLKRSDEIALQSRRM